MKSLRLLCGAAVLGAGGLVCGCAPTTQPLASTVVATPTASSQPGPQDVTPGYIHWDMSVPVHMVGSCDFPRSTLRQTLQGATSAAIVTVTGSGLARWNTLDGRRPTQAAVDALQHPIRVDGVWPVQPSIYTPYTMTVERPLRGKLSANASTSVFVESGMVAYVDAAGKPQRDEVDYACARFGPAAIGKTFLIVLGWDLTTHRTDWVQQPVLGLSLPYDPATDIVRGLDGPEKLGTALQGLPSQ